MVSVIYLKERKMKQQKLRASMLLMELMFLLIVVGGSVLLYNMFAFGLLSASEESGDRKSIRKKVKRMDLSEIGDEEMETLKSYEGQNLTFTIANKEMDPVYTTGPSQDTPYRDERQVHRNIVVYRKFF